jgi:hypothetical protein
VRRNFVRRRNFNCAVLCMTFLCHASTVTRATLPGHAAEVW